MRISLRFNVGPPEGGHYKKSVGPPEGGHYKKSAGLPEGGHYKKSPGLPERAPYALAILAGLLALQLPVAADQDAGRQGGGPQLESRERTLYVSAVDEKGEPVEGLGPDAFVVREDGVRREVLRVSRATEPIDIALLVDNSAAVQDEITFIRDALSTFVAKMAPGNQIALIALADRPTIFTDYTDDPKRLSEGIGRLFPMSQSGMTLLDAVFETARGLERRETPRAAIVAVFTDGIEFTNRYAKDAVAAARTGGAALHFLTIGQFFYSDEHAIRERSFLLDEGPRATGGQRITLLSPHGLEQAMQRVARELSSQYKVVYGRPASFIPPERIEVTSARPSVTMRGTPARGETGASK